MTEVKRRMIDIVNSVPSNFFDGLDPIEMVQKLIEEYIKIYGEDETTVIPGTDRHLNDEIFKKMINNV